jgi:hypothetical protein
MSPERVADSDYAPGRLRKAVQFLEAADMIHDLADDEAEIGDAYVTLCVHAGIAAADTLCAHHLRRYHSGDNHQGAIALLRRMQPAGPALAGDLSQLLSLKTKAGYTHRPVSAQDRLQADRRAHALVGAARSLPLS